MQINYRNNKCKHSGEGFVIPFNQINKVKTGPRTIQRLKFLSESLKIEWQKIYVVKIDQSIRVINNEYRNKLVHSSLFVGKMKEHTIEYIRKETKSAGAGQTLFYLDGENRVKATLVENVIKCSQDENTYYRQPLSGEKPDEINNNTITFTLLKEIIQHRNFEIDFHRIQNNALFKAYIKYVILEPEE